MWLLRLFFALDIFVGSKPLAYTLRVELDTHTGWIYFFDSLLIPKNGASPLNRAQVFGWGGNKSTRKPSISTFGPITIYMYIFFIPEYEALKANVENELII